MARRRNGLLLMIAGGGLGLVAAILVAFVVISSNSVRTIAPADPSGPVVVAAKDIPPNTIIDDASVVVKNFLLSSKPAGAAVDKKDVVGKFATAGVIAGQPIISNTLADTKGASGVSYSLKPGQVLTTVSFPAAAPLVNSGAVFEGDSIDVFVQTPGTSGTQIAYTMRNLKILYSGSVSGEPVRRRAVSTQLFFAVSPQEASILKFLETLNPNFNLRRAGDEDIVPAQIVDMNFIVSTYGLQRPR